MRALPGLLLMAAGFASMAAQTTGDAPAGWRPEAIVDLRTPQGAQLVHGQWRYRDAQVVQVDFRAPGPDLKPSGAPNRTYDISPHAGAVDFVNFDASEGGGVTEWRRAAALCAAAGVQMAHHEEPQIAQHLLAGVPHGTYVECFADPERDPVWQALWANRPAVKDGTMEVAAGPGFGLVLDSAMIRRYRC